MPKYSLGIEFDPPHLTVVQLAGTAKTYSVTFAQQYTIPHYGSAEEQAAAQQQALQELVSTQRLQADAIVTTIPAHHAVLRNLEVPFKDARRIRPALKFALEEHMPFEPDEVVADFQMLALPHVTTTSLLVAAAPQQVLAEHLALFQEMGLEPTIVDLDVFALANAALLGSNTLETHAILMDVRPTRTLLTLLYRGVPVFARSLAHSGVTETLLSVDRLSKQLQHTLYACENVLKQPYEPAVLLLSGILDVALATALEKETGLPTRMWQLANERYKSGKLPVAPDEQARYAVAFGAAARGLHRQAVGVNLRRERFELHRDIQELRGRLIGLGIMLVGVAGLGIGSLYLNNYFKAQRYEQLRAEIARVFQSTFPNTRMVQSASGVVASQMRDKARELDKRLEAFGGVVGAQLSGLGILREISARVPATLTVNIDNLTITTDLIDLSGTTTSYDEVVKLKEALETSAVFPVVKINNTKSGTDNKIDFKLTITTAKAREATS